MNIPRIIIPTERRLATYYFFPRTGPWSRVVLADGQTVDWETGVTMVCGRCAMEMKEEEMIRHAQEHWKETGEGARTGDGAKDGY